MKILITPSTGFDGSLYLQEILLAFGLCAIECAPLSEALATATPGADLLLLPSGSETEGVEPFLRAGGTVIAIQPSAELAGLAGLTSKSSGQTRSRLRFNTALCPGTRGEPLWTLGPCTHYETASHESINAYLFEPNDLSSECPGIVQAEVGTGSLTVFAYDPAQCIARIRQGYPERANIVPAGRPVPRSIHLHQPDPPYDTGWRPSADLHAAAFCEVVANELARHAPVPTLWHLPGGSPALLIFSGDEDGSTQEANQQEMSDLEAHDGAMSLYVIPDGTSITRELIESYTARGHTVSVHPNLVPTCGQSQDEQLACAEAQVLLFKELFGQPVRTLRNHCTMWPGYLELPLLWERLGIGMDADCFATRYMQSCDWGPYVNIGAAMPLPFVQEDGALIDVYQQPTHINDDCQCHPSVDYSQKYSAAQFDRIATRILDDAVRHFHAPLCANFHPCNYVSFATEHGLALMRRARERGMPIWSLDRWHDFWRARASWRMSEQSWDGNTLSYTLTGDSTEGLWITLPAAFGEKRLSTLTFNKAAAELHFVERFGQAVAHAPLPEGSGKVGVEVVYE